MSLRGVGLGGAKALGGGVGLGAAWPLCIGGCVWWWLCLLQRGQKRAPMPCKAARTTQRRRAGLLGARRAAEGPRAGLAQAAASVPGWCPVGTFCWALTAAPTCSQGRGGHSEPHPPAQGCAGRISGVHKVTLPAAALLGSRFSASGCSSPCPPPCDTTVPGVPGAQAQLKRGWHSPLPK